MVNYLFGKVYLLVNDVDDQIYIGSTTQKHLSGRMTTHRMDAKRRPSLLYKVMRTIGIEHFKIILFKNFPCANKDELEKEEYNVISEFKQKGARLLNTLTEHKITPDEVSSKTAGVNNARFNYGVIFLTRERGNQYRWSFSWTDNSKRQKKSFSCNKYGFWGAKYLAEAERKEIYPDWQTDEEMEIETMCNIDMD